MDKCAVDGCDQAGQPQICPWDGRYHHHGCIHYSNESPQLSGLMTFRPLSDGGWRWVCDQHYEVIKKAMAQHMEALRR